MESLETALLVVLPLDPVQAGPADQPVEWEQGREPEAAVGRRVLAEPVAALAEAALLLKV